MRLLALVALSVMALGCADSENSSDPSAAVLSVRADGCGPRVGIGSATLVADELAITAAHVVAGADAIAVRDRAGIDHDAQVVAFDPELDIALLSVPGELGRSLALSDRRVEAGDAASLTVLRSDGEVAELDVEIVRRANVATTDIYLDDDVTRPGFEIRADIEQGDSGSVVVVDGAATGVVWSRSLERDQRAWVVNISDAVRAAVDDGANQPVDTGACL